MLGRTQAALSSAAFLLLAGLAGGCSHQAWLAPGERAAAIAANAGFEARPLSAAPFQLASFQAAGTSGDDVLTVYLEGDGAPWPAPHLPPADPTPTQPLALVLATRDPRRPVAYIARPCQYLDKLALSNCHPRYWTNARFSAEVVATLDRAVSELKQRLGARRLRLVGYSGGGVLAALLALRRDDVDGLMTVAAPLDIAAWTAFHRITPLAGSLNPLDSLAGLARIRQVHLVGERDGIVPPEYVRSLQARMPFARFVVVPGQSHDCCWARDWPALVADASPGD